MFLVNDEKKIVTSGCRLSFDLLGHKLNNSECKEIVLMSLNSLSSGREEVGFKSNLNAFDTHNPKGVFN